jgi:hypothetical protein
MPSNSQGSAISATLLIAIVVLVTVTMVGVVSISLYMPDHKDTITLLIGFVTPVIMLLLAIQQQQLHKDVNSRLSELQVQTKLASHAQGMSDERANPQIAGERPLA